MRNETGQGHLLHIPVPWVYTIAYLVGIAIQLAYPVSITSAVFLVITYSVSTLFLVVGVVLAVWAQWIFHKERTSTDPTRTSAKLVTWGPYKFSRNPMYLGLFLAFIGLDGLLTFIWSLLLLIFVFYYVNWIVIPVEEKKLQKTFGDEYNQYHSRVRRWI